MDCCKYLSKDTRCSNHPAFTISYRIVKLLGEGVYGTVYHCYNKRSRLRYAVKVINLENIPQDKFVLMAHEERIVSQLDHPNIVRFHESIWGPRNIYLVFELLRGGQLYHDIARKVYYSEFDASSCMEQILSAVQYCHSKNIIHRDLKLDNILLYLRISVIYVKLIDFGIAMQEGETTPHLRFHSSSEFTAPEITTQEPHGKPVDMWSCGVVLYKLLVGLHPLPGTIFRGQRKRLPPRWDDISIAGRDLIERLLQLPQDTRITATQALEHEFIVGRDSGSSSDAQTSSSDD